MADKFSSMLRFNECLQYFDEWLSQKLNGASGSLKIKKTTGNKNYMEWQYSNGTKKLQKTNAIIIDNQADFNSSNAVAIFFKSGEKITLNINTAIKDLEGEDGPIQQMMNSRYRDAKIALENNQSYNNNQTAVTINSAQKNNDDEAAKYISDKDEYLERLQGTAIAQYMYLLSKSMKNPAYHFGQKVQTIDQAPYIKKKGMTINQEVEDIYITPRDKLPTRKLMRAFIQSDHFQMPNNPYGFTKQDALSRFDDNSRFDFNEYFYRNEIEDGILIAPSRDTDGVIVNLQKILTTPIPKGNGKSIDKMFLANSLTVDSAYIFDFHKKVHNNPNFNPKTIIINEGWATGRCNNHNVQNDPDVLNVVAWSASRVPKITEAYLKIYPNSQIILASDNDWKSFQKAIEKKGDQNLLDTVKNTGLLTSIQTYNLYAEDQHRIGVLIPPINFKSSSKNSASDFDDIRLHSGLESSTAAFASELEKLYERKKNLVDESVRIQKIYNEQAQYFASLYDITLKGISLTGEKTLDITPKSQQANQDIDLNHQNNSNHIKPAPPARPYVAGLFDVEITDDVKTAVDLKIEESISVLFDKKTPMAAVAKIQPEHISELVQNNTIEPVTNAPAQQPMIDPADFTLILCQNILINQFAELKKHNNKEDMIHSLEDNVNSMDNTLRTLNILMDQKMIKHVPETLDKFIEKYKDEPFVSQLKHIRNFASDQFIQKEHLDRQKLQSFHQSLTSIYTQQHKDIGFDQDVVSKIAETAITNKPIEEKRIFYRHFIQALENLTPDNAKWIHDVSLTLRDVYTSSNKEQTLSTEKKTSISYDLSP